LNNSIKVPVVKMTTCFYSLSARFPSGDDEGGYGRDAGYAKQYVKGGS